MAGIEFNGTHLEYLVAKGYIHYLFNVMGEKDKKGNDIINVYPHKTAEAALNQKENNASANDDYVRSLLDSPGDVVDASSGRTGKKFYIQNLFAL